MKKFIKSTYLVLIPIAIGVVCFLVGSFTLNSDIQHVGLLALVAGVPAVMIVLFIVGLILMLSGKLSDGTASKADTTDTTSTAGEDDDTATAADEANGGEANGGEATEKASGGGSEEKTLSQREREQNMINAVNNSSRYESRMKMAEYELQSVAEGMKNAPKWGVVLGLTSFFSLVALLIVATVLLINRIFVGAIICAALFAGIIITVLIVMTISRARAMHDDISKAKRITEGKVKACFMIGTTTMQTGGLRHGNGKTVRIADVTYRVIVIADGEEYGAFSKRFYETDEKVTIAVMGKKRAKIVKDEELEEITSGEETNNA